MERPARQYSRRSQARWRNSFATAIWEDSAHGVIQATPGQRFRAGHRDGSIVWPHPAGRRGILMSIGPRSAISPILAFGVKFTPKGYRKHSQHTRAGHRAQRGTRPCALRLRATCQHDCGGGWRDLPGRGPFRRRRCARRRNLYYLESSRRSGPGGGLPAEPAATGGAYRTRMGSGCRRGAEW